MRGTVPPDTPDPLPDRWHYGIDGKPFYWPRFDELSELTGRPHLERAIDKRFVRKA